MKNRIALALALCVAASAFANDGDTVNENTKWLYTEDEDTMTEIEVTVYKKDGTAGKNPVKINANSTVDGVRKDIMASIDESGTAAQAYSLAAQGLASALIEKYRNDTQSDQIDVLASSLGVLLMGYYGEIKIPDGSGGWTDAQKNQINATWAEIKKTVLQGRGAFRNGVTSNTETTPVTRKVTKGAPDLRVFQMRSKNNDAGEAWTFRGIDDLLLPNYWNGDNSFWNTAEWNGLPEVAKGNLAVVMYNKAANNGQGGLFFSTDPLIDGNVLHMTDGDAGKNREYRLSLRNWYKSERLVGSRDENLMYLITNTTVAASQLRQKVELVARYQEGENTFPELRYIPIGDIPGGSGLPLYWDGDSVTSYVVKATKPDEVDCEYVAVHGYKQAKELSKAHAISNYVPYVNNDSPIKWAGINSFFGDNIFKVSDSSGKILLNGISDSEDKVTVLAFRSGATDDEAVLAGFSCDDRSVDGGFNTSSGGQVTKHDTVQLHKWNLDSFTADAAPLGYIVQGDHYYTLADALTNANAHVGDLYVPVRQQNDLDYANSELRYIRMDKVLPIPPASDNKTIEYTADKDDESDIPTKYLRIKGSQDAAVANVPVMDEEGQLAWKRIGGDNGYGSALVVTNANDIDLEPVEIKNYSAGASRLTLRGWDVNGGGETGRGGFLYGCGQGGKAGPFHAVDMRGLTIGPYEAGSGNNYRILRIDGIDSNGVGRCSMPYKGGDAATSGLLWTPTAASAGASVSTPKALVSDGNRIYWGQSSSFTTFEVTGTDGNTRVMNPGGSATNRLEFAAAEGCNISANATLETDPVTGKEKIKVTIGVYYSSESSLNGGSGGGNGL